MQSDNSSITTLDSSSQDCNWKPAPNCGINCTSDLVASAIKKDQLNILQHLLNLDPMTIFKNRDNLLHIAALNVRYDIFAWLLNQTNLDLFAYGNQQQNLIHILRSITDKDGNSFLHLAAIKGDLKAVKWLVLEVNIYVKAQNNYGETALELAATNHHPTVEDWLRKVSTINLINAAKNGDIEMIKWLAKIELQRDLTFNLNLFDALQRATEFGHLEVVKWLVLHVKTEVDGLKEGERTALHVAAERGHLDIVQWLVLEGGADVSKGDSLGHNALHFAVIGGYLDVIKWLVKVAKADVDARSHNGTTPCMKAITFNRYEVMKWLVKEAKADPAKNNIRLWSSLHWAIFAGHASMVYVILEDKRVNVNAETDQGETPLHLASDKGLFNIVKLLVAYGAEIDAVDANGYTPLYLAARRGHIEIFRYLLVEAKANPELATTKGKRQ